MAGRGDEAILLNHDDLDMERIQVDADLPSYEDAVTANGQLHIGPSEFFTKTSMQAYCGPCQQYIQTKVTTECGSMGRRVAVINVCCLVSVTVLLRLIGPLAFGEGFGNVGIETIFIHFLFFFFCGFLGVTIPFLFSNLKCFRHYCPLCSVVLGSYLPKNFNKCTWKVVTSSVILLIVTSIAKFFVYSYEI